MSDWYWLVDGEITPAPGGKYLQPFEQRNVAQFAQGDASVSTVFLGLDHGLGNERPILFETLVSWSGRDIDQEMERYCTLAEAKAGHQRWVDAVNSRMADERATITTITVEAGVAIRGEIKRSILGFCATHGLTLEVQEDKGLLESLYIFRIKGDAVKAKALHDTLKRFETPDE